MREIKFRIWNPLVKQMQDARENTPVMLGMDISGIYIPDTTLPVMQYTGLKDCKGKEIYEGDILELKAQGSGYAVLNWVAVVEFGNPNGEYNWGWQLKPIKGVGINPDILLWVETEMPNVSCEVIGNIYQNHGLLERENG